MKDDEPLRSKPFIVLRGERREPLPPLFARCGPLPPPIPLSEASERGGDATLVLLKAVSPPSAKDASVSGTIPDFGVSTTEELSSAPPTVAASRAIRTI